MHNNLIKYFASFFFLLFLAMNCNLGVDEANWSYMAAMLKNFDLLPYQDTIDNKPPGIYYIFYLNEYFFGTNYIFPRLLGILGIIMGAKVSESAAKKLGYEKVSEIAYLAFILISGWQLFGAPYFAQTEVFMIVFTTLSFYFLVFKSGFLNTLNAGFFASIACNFKQVAVFTLITLLTYLIATRSFRKILTFSLAYTIGGIIVVLPLLLKGLDINNYIYGIIGILDKSGYPLSVWRIPKFFGSVINSKFFVFMVLLFPLYLFRFKRAAIKEKMLFLWFILTFIGLNSSGYYFRHHFVQVIPPLSLLLVIAAQKLVAFKLSSRATLIMIIVLLFPYKTFLDNLFYSASNIYNSGAKQISDLVQDQFYGASTGKKIGKWLRKRTKPSDYVYFVGIGELNKALPYSNRRSASKHFNADMFVKTRKDQKLVIGDLKQNKPEFIGIKNDKINDNFISSYIDRHYKKAKIFSNNTLFKREK